jgi:hypothetical protein
MADFRNMWQRLVVVVLVTAATLAPVTMASAQDNGQRQDGQGKYGQLTTQWWQWILEQPASGNPNLDATGADAANGQPGKGVFFLAGAFGGTPTREFTVPANTALFLPLLNNAGIAWPAKPNPQPKPNLNQVPQLRTLYAAPTIDSATGLHVTLDGVSLLGSVTRVKSPVFHFTTPAEDALFEFDPGTYTAVSDGYWLYLAPLPKGTHELKFGATAFGGPPDGFTVDITDIITVN